MKKVVSIAVFSLFFIFAPASFGYTDDGIVSVVPDETVTPATEEKEASLPVNVIASEETEVEVLNPKGVGKLAFEDQCTIGVGGSVKKIGVSEDEDYAATYFKYMGGGLASEQSDACPTGVIFTLSDEQYNKFAVFTEEINTATKERHERAKEMEKVLKTLKAE